MLALLIVCSESVLHSKSGVGKMFPKNVLSAKQEMTGLVKTFF